MYVYGYTWNENAFKYTPVEIEICGFEALTNTFETKTFDLVQMTNVFI